MRICLDLQACQTESRWRGIGRYARSLTRAVAVDPAGAELLLGVDATYPDAARQLRDEFGELVAPCAFREYRYPGPDVPIGAPHDGLRPAAEALVRRAYADLGADVVHVNSLFEGFVEHAAGLGRLTGLPGVVSSVTLYDLIPAVLPHWYLREEPYRSWYRKRLREMFGFDVVLCISEATRRDAIEHLGLPADRLAVIHAGVDPSLFRLEAGKPLDAAVRARFGIPGRYVLYTGNGDPRKNLAGAVEAFAALPATLRKGLQLVLNQVGDRAALDAILRGARVHKGEVVVTGHVTDAELVSLIRSCEVFFFPSLYEGFGLPVLEAMACGVAAICGDNSSLPEVVGRTDAVFDASKPRAAAAKLAEVLGDDGFRADLARQGRDRARTFTWERSAALALDAWREAYERRRRNLMVPVARPRRVRLALVTPLPPERTGIADYVAGLLPALRAHADVDLFTTADPETLADQLLVHDARPWTALEAVADDYDEVIYQVGNSPFHAHMLDLVRRVPGLVVLHDFFLSSLLGYLDQHGGRPGLLASELEHSHGRGACRMLATAEGRTEAIRAWPASRSIFDHADAVVVHSRHAVELARRYYPGVAAAPVVHLPMPIQALRTTADARRHARERLRLRDDELLIVSFGFLADTKLNLELIDAFGIVARTNDRVRLVFVGEPDGGDYGRACRERIERHPARERIHVTGFAEAEAYLDHLRAADVAVQLRTHSRGETSKSVLDCMAAGLPVIVNDYASFAELPDSAVAKVPASPTPADIAEALLRVVADAGERARLGADAAAHVAAVHDPAAVARGLVAVASEARARRRETAGDLLASALVHAVGDAIDRPRALAAVEHALESVPVPRVPRLYVDVTDVVQQDHGTGIHRVVRNLVRELILGEGAAMQCVPVMLDAGGGLVSAEDFVHTRLGIPPTTRPSAFEPAAGDVLFLLDSTWTAPERFVPHVEALRRAGGRCYAMVYDTIPLDFPQYCVDFMPDVLRHWLRFVAEHCDGLVCISRAVADDVLRWLRDDRAAHRPRLRIGHVPLGSDLVEQRIGERPSDTLADAMEPAGSAVLMVGTLEPRKRHDLVLDAFERLWDAGDARRLVIVGKRGWNVESLVERIERHAEYNRRLFWFQGVSDEDLAHAYRLAERVVQASDAEGFGLPIVEALRAGCAVLASDLPVFREVGGEAIGVFRAGSVDDLVRALSGPPVRGAVPTVPTWTDSAAQVRRALEAGTWDHVLP